MAKIASRGGEWLGSFSILAGRMVCASLCLSADQRRARKRERERERDQQLRIKRESLRDIESDDREETQRKREREKI